MRASFVQSKPDDGFHGVFQKAFGGMVFTNIRNSYMCHQAEGTTLVKLHTFFSLARPCQEKSKLIKNIPFSLFSVIFKT
jgi:hypothetical protein